MADRQPLKATFFAFRKRDRGGVLTGATIAFIVAGLVLAAAFAGVFWTSLAPVANWYAELLGAAATQDPSSMEGIGFPPQLGMLFLGLFVWCFFFFLLYASFEAACLRWMIRGETGGFMGLTLGADTWRVYSTYWLWFLLYMGFSIALGIVMVMLIGVFAVSSGGDPGATISATIAGYVLQYALLIYFAVRFAPAAATSIARRRFSFFQAWQVTKGRFWSLFGSFFVWCLINFLFGLIMAGVWFSVVLAGSLPDWSSVGADPAALNRFYIEMMQRYVQSFTQPSTWMVMAGLQVANAIVAVLIYVGMFGVNARAAQAALEEGKIQPAA